MKLMCNTGVLRSTLRLATLASACMLASNAHALGLGGGLNVGANMGVGVQASMGGLSHGAFGGHGPRAGLPSAPAAPQSAAPQLSLIHI